MTLQEWMRFLAAWLPHACSFDKQAEDTCFGRDLLLQWCTDVTQQQDAAEFFAFLLEYARPLAYGVDGNPDIKHTL